MNRLLFAFCMLLLITTFSCKKNPGYIGDIDNPPTIVLPEPITATIQGNVVDENDLPAVGVSITVGTQIITTDSKGFFRITGASLDKNASLVTAQKVGYFKAIRTFSATSGTNQVNIKLLKKTLTGTVNASSGGEVSLSNGSKIALQANGIVTAASGAAYTGSVHVYATYIDPTANDIDQIIPGSLMADDKNGSRVTMASYGMIAVELESASGEKLQIKTGNTATLTTAIPASLQATAPATIALWSVNEETGLWKEEGTATKTGSNYVGQVNHFSFWNCDIGLPAVQLTITLQDNNGNPIVHARVKLSYQGNYVYSSYGVTDSLGVVSGLVPANQSLTLEVLTSCNTVIYTQNIGAFNQNTTLSPITLSATLFNNSLLTVKGNLVNCFNAPVTNGYAIINYENNSRWVAVDTSGNFSVTFIRCSNSTNTVNVIGVDNTTQEQGIVSNIIINNPVTNVPAMIACGISSSQFIHFTLNGKTYDIIGTIVDTTIYGTTSGTTVYTTTLCGFSSLSYVFIKIMFNHSNVGVGVYPVNNYISIEDNLLTSYFQHGLTNVNVTLTHFPQNVGEFYEGTFSGTFATGGGPLTNTLTDGSFRIRRIN